jgi:hypothetical protein
MGVGGKDVEVGKSQDSEPVDAKPTEPAAETPIMKLCFWLSNLVVIPFAALFAFAGWAKVSGGMDEMLAERHAPFQGVPVLAIKILAFFGHLTGGVCMLGGIIAKIITKLQGKKADFLETLILMDGIGLSTIAIGSVFQHVMLGESWFTPLVPILAFPLLRFAANGFALPEGNVLSTSFPNRKLFLAFAGVNVVGFLLSIVMHLTLGTIGIVHS